MLVIRRMLGEKVFIGDNICITVVDIDRDKIRLGIEAPRDVPIYRQELLPIHGQQSPSPQKGSLTDADPDLLRELTTFHDYAIQLGIHHCGQDGQPCPVQAAINKATGVTS